MSQADTEKNVVKYLPGRKQLLRDIVVQVMLACVLGPLVGPFVVRWINPTQAWGVGAVGDYSPASVLLWGMAFLMFEAFIYTGWLISRARKGWGERETTEWWNQQQ